MGKLVLHGSPTSTCSRRVLTALAELNTDCELVVIDLMKGEQKQPKFLEMQPFGQIPVLFDGDYKVFESRAIARYISETLPGGEHLYPKDPKVRGQVEQWISVEQSHYRAADQIVGELVFKKYRGLTADQAVVADADTRLHATLAVMNKHLGHHKFLAADHFTLADLVYMPYTDYLLHCEGYTDLFDKYPHVKAWWTSISSRPSWKKATGK